MTIIITFKYQFLLKEVINVLLSNYQQYLSKAKYNMFHHLHDHILFQISIELDFFHILKLQRILHHGFCKVFLPQDLSKIFFQGLSIFKQNLSVFVPPKQHSSPASQSFEFPEVGFNSGLHWPTGIHFPFVVPLHELYFGSSSLVRNPAGISSESAHYPYYNYNDSCKLF